MKRLVLPAMAAGLAICAGTAQAAYWTENFDGYTNGQVLSGVDGWSGWANTEAAAGVVSNVHSVSAPNGLRINKDSDAVREFVGFNTGTWVFETQLWAPIKTTGICNFIMMDQYGANNDWAVQIAIDLGAATLKDDYVEGNTITLVRNAFAPLKIEIDFAADTRTIYYNNQLVSTAEWTHSENGMLQLAAIDLFGNGITNPVYYDNFVVTQTVPEPATFAVLGLGALALIRRRRK